MSEPLDVTALSIESAEPPEHVKPDHKASSDGHSRARDFFSSRGKKDSKSTSQRPQRSKRPAPPNSPGQFIEPVEEFYNTVALFMMPFKPRVAMAFMSQAHDCAVAWDDAAQKNENLRRLLFGLSVAGTWSKVFMAHAPILAAIVMEKSEDTPIGDMMEQYLKTMADKESKSE